jgi:trk system potassium uptake protein TrkA
LYGCHRRVYGFRIALRITDVIMSIGENQGANVMATALFKTTVKKLISRAISTFEKVLMAIGVDRIVHPEQESAER